MCLAICDENEMTLKYADISNVPEGGRRGRSACDLLYYTTPTHELTINSATFEDNSELFNLSVLDFALGCNLRKILEVLDDFFTRDNYSPAWKTDTFQSLL
jgi:hypothetical protein